MPEFDLDGILEDAENRRDESVVELVRYVFQLRSEKRAWLADKDHWRERWYRDDRIWTDAVDHLHDAIINHRNVHRETDDVHRRHLANHMLWALVDGDDRPEQEWHNGG